MKKVVQWITILAFVFSSCCMVTEAYAAKKKNKRRSKRSTKSSQKATPAPAPVSYDKDLLFINADPALCKTGKLQSPINLVNATPGQPTQLQFSYGAAPIMIGRVDNLLQVVFPQEITDEFLHYNGQQYRLKAMVFHAPSEHAIDGRGYPMEIEFVHENDKKQLLVVSSFVSLGLNHLYFDAIIDNIPKEMNKVVAVKKKKLNPVTLIPTDRSYFTYQGSLTSAPCTEGVTWIVFKNPVLVGPEQLQLFQEGVSEHNARQVQHLNNRHINEIKS